MVSNYTDGVLDSENHCYFSADWNNIEERVGTETVPSIQRVWGRRGTSELCLEDSSEVSSLDRRYYAVQDSNRSVAAIVDPSGVVVERFAYDTYGACTRLDSSFTVVTTPVTSWHVLFAGYELDNSGLYAVRFRQLSPTLGCWLSRDPLGYVDGDNLYEYTSSSPYKFTDPFGLQKSSDEGCCVWIVLFIEIPSGKEPDLLSRAGLAGHTGIAIGKPCDNFEPNRMEFYDFGPSDLGKGRKGPFKVGRPWLDRFDYPEYEDGKPTGEFRKGAPEGPGATLGNIYLDIDNLRKGRDVYEVSFRVSKDEASKVKAYWERLYKSPPIYALPGKQCTSTSRDSLQEAGLYWNRNLPKPIGKAKGKLDGKFNIGALAPQTFLQSLRDNLRHTCGKSKGRAPSIKRIASGPGRTE